MKLTDKCKEDFEKWYSDWRCGSIKQKDIDFCISIFDKGSNSMRYGVYVDFFDSLWYVIHIEPIYYDGWDFGITISKPNGGLELVEPQKTRQEARTKAIEKANKIYNDGN